MIGKVKLPDGTEAVLNDDGAWDADDEALGRLLNGRFDPRQGAGLQVLPFGYGALFEAAKYLGGEARPAKPLAPLPPDEVS